MRPLSGFPLRGSSVVTLGPSFQSKGARSHSGCRGLPHPTGRTFYLLWWTAAVIQFGGGTSSRWLTRCARCGNNDCSKVSRLLLRSTLPVTDHRDSCTVCDCTLYSITHDIAAAAESFSWSL